MQTLKTKRRTAGDALNIAQAARLLGVHEETVRRLARKDAIPCFKVGRDWRFSRAHLVRWTERPHAPSVPTEVLIVDDDADFRALMRKILEREGFAVRAAADGVQALDMVRERIPSVVLLDLRMNIMNGAEVIARLRAPHPELPVILVTAYPDSDLVSQALRFPPVTLLPKPLSAYVLLKTIRMALAAGREVR